MSYVITKNNIKFHYQVYGEGEPVIFLHGFTIDSRMWKAQIESISAHYRMILMDARGHGLSDAPPTGYGRSDRVTDLFQFADELKLEQFHLIGLSMGGSTAIGAALQNQNRLKSLSLISTGAAGYSPGKKIEHIDKIAQTKGLEDARKQWMDWSLRWLSKVNYELENEMRTMMLQHSGAVWQDEKRGKYPRLIDLEHVHKISTPTLIIVGSEDRIFVPLARQLHAKINNSKLIIYEGIGHMLNMEAPDRFNEDFLFFLKSIS